MRERGKNKQTTKKKQKQGTSQRKCEMWWSRSVRHRYHRRHHWRKTAYLFLTGHRLAVQLKNKQRKATWADLFCRFFELALPLSPDQWARTHRHSERTCAREWSSDGRTSSAFFSVKVNVWPTESYHKQKKTFLGISPRRYVPESTMMGPSAAPVLQ